MPRRNLAQLYRDEFRGYSPVKFRQDLLAGLTVGIIPLALDQVLLGAVDRSRNPEVKLALVLGLNEPAVEESALYPWALGLLKMPP